MSGAGEMTPPHDAEEMLARFGAAPGAGGPTDLADARRHHDAIALAFNGNGPQDVVATPALAPRADGGAVPLRMYRPHDGGGDAPTLLWMHGGGFVFGSLDSADSVCRRFAAALDCTVVSVDYRLGPEHTADEASADVDAAWAWASRQPGATAGVVAGGDSAGATLAALLAQRLRDRGDAVPLLQLLAYPVTALDEVLDAAGQERADSFGFPWGVRRWLGDRDASHPAISPLRARLEGSGRVHMVYGTADYLADQDRRYADALRAAGVDVSVDVVQDMPHGFFSWDCGVDASVAAFDRAVAAVRRAARGARFV